MTALSERISLWIADKVRGAGAKGVVVGLSGGIDSSAVAVLAKRAPGIEILGLILPCHSPPLDEEHARLLAQKFAIRTERMDLTPIFDLLIGSLPPGDKVARGNLRPRLRMLTLYYFANARGYLVAGTGNRTELMIGYFTKYGDGGVDILPLGDLFKRQVRGLARELGIPQEIIAKPPSAGLWEGQTDEGEIGLSYETLDGVLLAIETGRTEGCDEGILRKVREMMAASEHKRAPIPKFEIGREI